MNPGRSGTGGAKGGAGSDAAGTTDDPSALQGRRVLLVEDETMLALEIEMELRDFGADVIGPVTRLDEGIELLDGEPQIDAAILDLDLHGRDAFPLAERLRNLAVPFVFHTGHGSPEQLQSSYPGVPVCSKPMMAEALLARVAGLLDP